MHQEKVTKPEDLVTYGEPRELMDDGGDDLVEGTKTSKSGSRGNLYVDVINY